MMLSKRVAILLVCFTRGYYELIMTTVSWYTGKLRLAFFKMKMKLDSMMGQ